MPAAVLVLTGQIDETSARLPFALAGMAALVAIWLLGWRLINGRAGWIAALLLALSGYYVAFARFVQYQSVVILATAAALLALAALLGNRAPPRASPAAGGDSLCHRAARPLRRAGGRTGAGCAARRALCAAA